MTHKDLKATLEKWRITQTQFARWIGVTNCTVNLWANGRAPIPGYVEIIVNLVNCMTHAQKDAVLHSIASAR